MDYKEIFKRVTRPTLLSDVKIKQLYDCLELSTTLAQKGTFCEVGVYKGGSANFIAEYLKETNNKETLCLVDTFTGIPNHTAGVDNIHGVGDFNDTDIQDISNFFVFSKTYKNISIINGDFAEKNSYVIKHAPFQFVHLDVDVYESYVNALKFFKDKMTEGGILLCDDYSAPSCLGAYQAIEEFKEQIDEEEISFIKCQQDQCYFWWRNKNV